MNPNYTHISILLDRSGSMDSIKDDVIGGINNLLAEQKIQPGKLTVTMAQFDTYYDTIVPLTDINNVQPLTAEVFIPRGFTALFDSAVRLINETGAALAALDESERPAKVLFVMFTDGKDNEHLTDLPKEQWQDNKTLGALIKQQTEIYKWEFVYLGANQDAFAVAQTFGTSGYTYQANAAGTQGVHKAFSRKMSMMRSSANLSEASLDFMQSDVDEATKEEEQKLSK